MKRLLLRLYYYFLPAQKIWLSSIKDIKTNMILVVDKEIFLKVKAIELLTDGSCRIIVKRTLKPKNIKE